MCITDIIHDWKKVSPRSRCLSPKTWLEGESIEQLAALGHFSPVLQFCATNRALNYDDLVIIPFNTDISGSGCHWVLATANFREREISVFNSIHSLKTLKHVAPTLMKIIAYIFTSATENLQASDWKISDVVNTPQQDNGYDCGVFVVVNACAIIDNTPFGPVNSVKARMWIHSLIEKYEPQKDKLL
uniref:Ubiquitin-like protease family profile domain-containing protein n=1 Tax=Sinocyclocheilus anshuiensis TaxID=1608454 RepID=A0A671RNL3_9TELE